MDYFVITQDNRIINRGEPVGITKAIFQDDALDETMPLQFRTKEQRLDEFVDFIERLVPLVSEPMKEILEMYAEESAVFFPVVLADTKRGVQRLYWYPRLPKLECLSNKTDFNKNGTIKRLSINPEQVTDYRLFQIGGIMESFIVCDLVVAESLLRRNFVGFKLERIKQITEEC